MVSSKFAPPVFAQAGKAESKSSNGDQPKNKESQLKTIQLNGIFLA
jgi:hypothetical protein